MKYLIIFACCLLSVVRINAQKGYWENRYDYIENTAVFEENQEEGRAWYIPANNLSLNGLWKFFWADTPEGIPEGFFNKNYSDKKWSLIKVPSNWEMEGYGDKLFRNVTTPFKPIPPKTPREYNPTGVYRRDFTLPASWKGQQIFLRFEKVASASFVWINGREAGYNEGAQEPAEYNITPYLIPGKNNIAVAVLKYSDGYYLEDQDYWRLAGIFDDVCIYATPNVRLFDWQIITDLDPSCRDAQLDVTVDVKNYGTTGRNNMKITSGLYDSRQQLVTNLKSGAFRVDPSGKASVQLTAHVPNPKKWTAETPDLYHLHIRLLKEDNQPVDSVSVRLGFKKTEIIGETFYLNGRPLKVNAMNSHMQHPEFGHVMDEATIRKDFEILKQFNFNAVRTSHYPPVNKYLELADEYGFYIIDETGDEAHATEWVSGKEEYTAMYLDRVRRMVLRDRNHPCVLFWSAGNESGEGFNITEVIREGKQLDSTRYWMYGGNAFSHPAEDIIGPRYPVPMELEVQIGRPSGQTDRCPSFMDEYLSVAGNGGGGMDEYWDVIYRYPRCMGGAIWDFVSPGLTEKIRALYDSSPSQAPVHIMGNAKLVTGPYGKAIDLNGHDQWVEVYRDSALETFGNELTLTCMLYPRKLVSSCGSFITKGNYQFGLQQHGKSEIVFYIYTNQKYTISATLPEDWENKWHNVACVYNGKEMFLYIDGKESAKSAASGTIRNFPFPINIGRNAEIHGQETSVYICDAIIDRVGIFKKAMTVQAFSQPAALPGQAALWLDFERETDQGTFYSYGIGARTYGSIWPDRRVQPEMWQMKKTVQPVSFELLDATTGLVEVWNRNHFLDASHYQASWTLETGGKVIERGELLLSVPALSKQQIRIPYSRPSVEPGKEYFLNISVCLKDKELWAPAGFEVAWDQFLMPWYQYPEPVQNGTNAVKITANDDDHLVVEGEGFKYIFDKRKGILTSIQYRGKEMIREGLSLNVWRAPLANELDGWSAANAKSLNWKEGYGNHVATEFYSTGIDRLLHLPVSFDAREIAENIVVDIRDIFLMNSSSTEKKDLYVEGMACNGFENMYRYTVHGSGGMEIEHTVNPNGKMPKWLPRIGLTLVLDKDLDRVEWFGRGPQENYPDRKTGYRIGLYKSTVKEMYEPYLLPEDYGLRTDNRWVKLTGQSGVGLRFTMDQHFNFNAYPFTTDNLTKAVYTYQLQPFDGITMNLDYATSGVGCTSRSILDAYRVMPGMYTRKIVVEPVYK